MPKIRELPQHVADLIAAGEVVERPGSVVKELMENAIDAGATALTVEIKSGGMSYIRVTDNGCGIAYEDVETAFLRHATSKIKKEDDLESIETLGFRGEALAAIASVSKTEMITKEENESQGTSITLEGGIVTEKDVAGCPSGTTIIVRNLFYNTPARLKFMKKDVAEGANVFAVVQKIALSHPEVSVKFIKDDKTELHTPGDGKLISCIYGVFGREFALSLIETGTDFENVRVSGFITKPENSRGNRTSQHFFVNGRYIKSRMLQAALEEGYKNELTAGRFPGCVLHIGVKIGDVDVNVHPAKTEVRFLNERRIFDAVCRAVTEALKEYRGIPEIVFEKKTYETPAAPYRNITPYQTSITPEEREEKADNRAEIIKILKPASEISSLSVLSDSAKPEYLSPQSPENKPEKPRIEEQNTLTAEPFKIIGEVFNTYVIAETKDGLLFIDKHAAHERILFDSFINEDIEVMQQYLITPVVFDLSMGDTGALLENAEILSKFGFEIEEFGDDSIIIRQAPAGLDADDIIPVLSELAESFTEGKRATAYKPFEAAIHTIACHSAIRAGKKSDESELKALISKVLAGEIKHCPHGRPVSISFSKSSLEKNFKRT